MEIDRPGGGSKRSRPTSTAEPEEPTAPDGETLAKRARSPGFLTTNADILAITTTFIPLIERVDAPVLRRDVVGMSVTMHLRDPSGRTVTLVQGARDDFTETEDYGGVIWCATQTIPRTITAMTSPNFVVVHSKIDTVIFSELNDAKFKKFITTTAAALRAMTDAIPGLLAATDVPDLKIGVFCLQGRERSLASAIVMHHILDMLVRRQKGDAPAPVNMYDPIIKAITPEGNTVNVSAIREKMLPLVHQGLMRRLGARTWYVPYSRTADVELTEVEEC